MEHEGDVDINCGCCTWNNPQRLVKGLEHFEKKRTRSDYPDYSIIKIGKNTEESPRDFYETCCHSDFCEKASTSSGEKNSQKSK